MTIRRPFIVEFTGTPESGKTSTIKQVVPLLEASPYLELNGGVTYVQEPAEIAPKNIPKGSFDANCWMKAYLVTQLLENFYNFPHNYIIIVDRGIIDSQFFNYKLYTEDLCSKEEFLSISSIIDNPKLLPDLLIHFTVLAEESIRRRGSEGRLVTLNWVKQYNNLFEKFASSITVPTFFMDTTSISQNVVVEKVTSKILSDYEIFKQKMTK